MTRRFTLCFIFILGAGILHAQVSEIKSASTHRSESSSSRGSSSGSTSSDFAANFLFNFMFNEVINWQQQTLQRKQEIPSIISLDLMMQGAVQPSSYYILNPRIRANWGLFSTDFRFNYILEEDIDGVKYLRTNDWQVLQLNILESRDASFRIGGGFIQEAFEGKNRYPEWTAALHISPWGRRLGGIGEFRQSLARREVNAHLHYSIFDRGALHGYLTVGAMFQRYYQTVNVWGLQGGFTMSIY